MRNETVQTAAEPGVGIFHLRSAREEPYRENLPSEEWLFAACNQVMKAIRAAIAAHEAVEGVTCQCSLHTDMLGMAFNLEGATGLLTGELIHTDNIEDLESVIERRTRLEPAINRPEEDQLLRVFDLLLSACDAVDDAHNEAHPSGRCSCVLCADVWGLSYTVQLASNLIGSVLLSVPTERAAAERAEEQDEYDKTVNLLRQRTAGHEVDCGCGRCKALARLLAYEDDMVDEEAQEEADTPAMAETAQEARAAAAAVDVASAPAVASQPALRQKLPYWLE